MFAATVRRLAQSGKDSLPKQVPFAKLSANPYKARKVWPPNFKELSHGQQLRFEKKYKRRIFLASRSPRWQKGVKFAQLATIAGKSVSATPAVTIPLTSCSCARMVVLLFRI